MMAFEWGSPGVVAAVSSLPALATLGVAEWRARRRRVRDAETVFVGGAAKLIEAQQAQVVALSRRIDELQVRQDKREQWFSEQLAEKDRQIAALHEEIATLRRQVNGKH